MYAWGLEIAHGADAAYQRPNVVAAPGESTREMTAGKPGRAGYEDAHRSATSVTGEPKILRRPARSKNRSTASVNRFEAIAS